MAEEVLKSLEDIESYSFYGLWHWLSEANDLLDQIDSISLSAPKTHDQLLLEQKDELLSAQTQLRRQMGALLEEPLTRRERPKAEEFLEAQLRKLQSQASNDRMASAVQRVQALLAKVKTSSAAEAKEVREIEEQVKQADAQWKELEPIYVKWQAGRHSFKSNADLQSFQRRYEDAKKIRATAPERLEAALRRRRSTAPAPLAPAPSAGWVAARKAPPKAAPSNSGRGAAAVALDQPKVKAKSSWTNGLTLAQRLRAEAAAQVRSPAPDVAKNDADGADDDFFWEETVRPPPPPVPPVPPVSAEKAPQDFVTKVTKSKGVPPTAPKKASLASMANGGRRWGRVEVEESVAESEEEPEVPPAAEREKIFTTSAKKKSKRKKKSDAMGAEDEVEESSATSSKSWVLTLQATVAHTVLEELLRRESWSFEEPEARSRLASLAERLPWQSPLGFLLPFSWSSFLALDVDCGPKRRSRRGESDALLRLRHNVPRLLPFYLTLVLGLLILHALSHFGLLMWIMALQTALLLLPLDQLPNFKASAQVQALQAVHFLLWIFFVRSLWQMHVLIKVSCVALVVGHAYSVREVVKDDQ